MVDSVYLFVVKSSLIAPLKSVIVLYVPEIFSVKSKMVNPIRFMNYFQLYGILMHGNYILTNI